METYFSQGPNWYKSEITWILVTSARSPSVSKSKYMRFIVTADVRGIGPLRHFDTSGTFPNHCGIADHERNPNVDVDALISLHRLGYQWRCYAGCHLHDE